MRNFVQPGDVVSFSNGMIGTITKAFRLALIDETGCLVSTKYMPLFTDYQDEADTWPVRVEESHKVDENTEFFTVWFDEGFYTAEQRLAWRYSFVEQHEAEIAA